MLARCSKSGGIVSVLGNKKCEFPMRRTRNHRFQQAFGTRLKSARITSGFETADAFAQAISMETATYRSYERGDRAPDYDVIAEIAKVTGYSLDWLIAGRGKPRVEES